MNQALTPSPYGPQPNQKSIDRATFDRIKKELGVASLLIVMEDAANDCNGANCLGHMTFFRSEGFNEHNLGGVGEVLINYGKEISKSNELMP